MFGFNFDKKTIYIILGILILMSLTSFNADSLLSLLLTLPGVIIAITFHEFAHAFAADRLGDTTPKNQGRLNLNPLSHIDPVGFVLLIFAHFGWGKPVQINPNNFTKNVSMETGEAIVSIAGPAMNLLIAIILTIIYYIIYTFFPMFMITNIGSIIITLILATITVNIGLCIFNLIPLPPLDGSKIFIKFIPYKLKYWFQQNEQMLYMIFLLLWITGLAGKIVSPVISIVTQGIFKFIGLFFKMF